MIRAIMSSPIVRRTIAGAMFAGAVAAGAGVAKANNSEKVSNEAMPQSCYYMPNLQSSSKIVTNLEVEPEQKNNKYKTLNPYLLHIAGPIYNEDEVQDKVYELEKEFGPFLSAILLQKQFDDLCYNNLTSFLLSKYEDEDVYSKLKDCISFVDIYCRHESRQKQFERFICGYQSLVKNNKLTPEQASDFLDKYFDYDICLADDKEGETKKELKEFNFEFPSEYDSDNAFYLSYKFQKFDILRSMYVLADQVAHEVSKVDAVTAKQIVYYIANYVSKIDKTIREDYLIAKGSYNMQDMLISSYLDMLRAALPMPF